MINLFFVVAIPGFVRHATIPRCHPTSAIFLLCPIHIFWYKRVSRLTPSTWNSSVMNTPRCVCVGINDHPLVHSFCSFHIPQGVIWTTWTSWKTRWPMADARTCQSTTRSVTKWALAQELTLVPVSQRNSAPFHMVMNSSLRSTYTTAAV